MEGQKVKVALVDSKVPKSVPMLMGVSFVGIAVLINLSGKLFPGEANLKMDVLLEAFYAFMGLFVFSLCLFPEGDNKDESGDARLVK